MSVEVINEPVPPPRGSLQSYGSVTLRLLDPKGELIKTVSGDMKRNERRERE